MTNIDTSGKLKEQRGLARQLGLFGTIMAVMGGIIGAGIFINPYLVADRVHRIGQTKVAGEFGQIG